MPIRPTDIPNLQATQIGTARVDPRAAAAPAAAVSELADAVASVGEPFLELANQTHRAEQAAILSEKRSGLRRGWAERQLELDKITDPLERIRLADEFLAQSRQDLDDPKLTADSRLQLREDYDRFADSAFIGVRAQAHELTQRRAGLASQNEMAEGKRTGDRATFERGLKTGQDAGVILPEEADRLRTEFDIESTFNTLAREIDEDPIGMERELDSPEAATKWGNLGQENLDRLRRSAQIAANRDRSEMWDGILNRSMDEGTNSAILSKEELQQMAAQGLITPEQRASYLTTYHASTPPPFDPQIYNEAFGAIASYDPAADPTGATLAQLRGNLATLPLPKESLSELRNRLNDRVKPEEPKKHKLAGDFARLTTEAFDSGRFGNWYTYADHDNDPRTMNRKVIAFDDFGRALATQRRFTDSFDAWLRNQGEDLDPVKAQETYDQLFERIVLDQDDPQASPVVPGAPALRDFEGDVDRLLGVPSPETSATGKAPGTFGGQPIRPVGTFYRNTRASVFGGPNDPADNGLSAFGGTTGDGGKQGVAIPQAVLEATFPGKDKAWLEGNVYVMVKTDDGRQGVFPVVDFGTAEWVWERDKRPVLDLTEGAVRQLGGQAIYDKAGKLTGVRGIGNLSFALTTANAGPQADLRGMTWADAQDAWFKDKKPTSAEQITSGLAALKTQWLEANAGEQPWGDGTGGSVLPAYPNQ